MNQSPLPSLGDLLLPLLMRVPVHHQPLFIAIAERAAAERYLGWASHVSAESTKASLRACADRENKIATLIESLYADAKLIQSELLSSAPELTDTSFFAQFSIADQFAIQAQGERLGAETWRSLAKEATSTQARNTFLECALLEEESAVFLESLPSSDAV